VGIDIKEKKMTSAAYLRAYRKAGWLEKRKIISLVKKRIGGFRQDQTGNRFC
jgi:hypothetical protein